MTTYEMTQITLIWRQMLPHQIIHRTIKPEFLISYLTQGEGMAWNNDFNYKLISVMTLFNPGMIWDSILIGYSCPGSPSMAEFLANPLIHIAYHFQTEVDIFQYYEFHGFLE